MHISYSRVSTYMRCPFAHYLSYVKKLTPREPSRPLSFGSDFHKLLEHRSKKSEVKKALQEIKEVYYDMSPKHQSILGDNYVEDLKTIFTDYMKVYKGSSLPDVTEQKFEMRIGTHKDEPVYFVGVIDGLYFGDKLLIEEHKTFSRKPDANALVMNMQKCLYAKAVQKFYGSFPDGVIWDYIKSTPAKEPIWLEKSEKFSVAKNENITPFSWVRACKKHGVTSEAVLNQGNAHYSGNIQNFFFRRQLDFTEEMINCVWDSFMRTVKMICKYGEQDTAMNITKDCSWCSFQPICYAMMTGGNVDYAIDKDFTEKQNQEQEEGKEVLKG